MSDPRQGELFELGDYGAVTDLDDLEVLSEVRQHGDARIYDWEEGRMVALLQRSIRNPRKPRK